MDRSLWAVLAGTFTLRFSTGLTGAMLGAYLATLPQHGGEPVSPIVVGLFSATFYLAELVLSPIFGILSDRQGHHRVMLYGPAFGAVAVILTGLTTNLLVLGGTRWLEGASTAASVPSILGYIAMVTAGNELLRGKASARFEGATLLGLGAGFAVAPILFAALGPAAFFLNALLYGGSFLIFWTVKDPAGEAAAVAAPHVGFSRYLELLRSSHVWLLAPTWIAVNASIGLWFSQSIFQFAKADPRFPDQFLMQGFTAGPDLGLGPRSSGSSSGSGCCTGATASRSSGGRRSSCTASSAAARSSPPGSSLNHVGRVAAARRPGRRARRRRVRAVRDGRRDPGRARPAGRHLRALPQRPRRDHGPVLGVPGRRPDHRGDHRRVRGGGPRDRRDARRHRRPARRRPRPARPAAPRRGPSWGSRRRDV